MRYRLIRKWWRAHGSKIILICIIIFAILKSSICLGIIMLIGLTTPCGIMKVNTNKWLWFGRQFLYFSIGAGNVIMEFI